MSYLSKSSRQPCLASVGIVPSAIGVCVSMPSSYRYTSIQYQEHTHIYMHSSAVLLTRTNKRIFYHRNHHFVAIPAPVRVQLDQARKNAHWLWSCVDGVAAWSWWVFGDWVMSDEM
ncbi:hypothetical protein EJ05DRAFT_169665 [Pseudovirgaria hyperparasitica]|uniref:Uncharacterized protein n=1 Tax=Pseudovirgaria hyperparasitica TaxID=470096 RepID=A0A6A6VVA4_9PEZI|nr:uncharacterized protein EJ05DRAFT_169665 [Pseudovirgaria hyperparasitica]KAF2753716.1 hypothetical protein EJ05DRAFT_169665 [Pseudovirgaria hyperparasitica]